MTPEPFRIAPELIGRPLSTIRRRGLAFGVDGALALTIGVPALVLAAILALWVQAPASVSGGILFMFGQADLGEAEMDAIQLDIFRLVHRRRPTLLPAEIAQAVESGDPERLARAIENVQLLFTLDSSESRWVPAENRLELHSDVVFGPLASTLSLVTFVLGYFALLGMRGRTPGKWLLGVRVRRLDGEPMTLWASFQRAGGYSASVSTLGLGFLTAIRDPNRQTLHDRICSTVVLREPKPRRIRPVLQRLAGLLRRRR